MLPILNSYIPIPVYKHLYIWLGMAIKMSDKTMETQLVSERERLIEGD